MNEVRTLTLDEIDDEVTNLIVDIVDGYFLDTPIARGEMLDRLETYLYPRGVVLPGKLDDPVCDKIIAIARKAKKQATA